MVQCSLYNLLVQEYDCHSGTYTAAGIAAAGTGPQATPRRRSSGHVGGARKAHSRKEHRLEARTAANGAAGVRPPLDKGVALATERVRAPHPTLRPTTCVVLP